MAGRPKGSGAGVRLTEDHRAKIQNSNILNVLIEHVLGNREMSSTQVTAGIALLKKSLPDLTSVDMKALVEGNIGVTFQTVYEAAKPE